MFGFLKRPEDVQNEFVAVERGKSPTNPDYMRRLFWLFCFQGSLMVIIGKREGWRLSPFSLVVLAFDALCFTRGCLPLGQQYPPLKRKPRSGFRFLISPEPVDVWPPLA